MSKALPYGLLDCLARSDGKAMENGRYYLAVMPTNDGIYTNMDLYLVYVLILYYSRDLS